MMSSSWVHCGATNSTGGSAEVRVSYHHRLGKGEVGWFAADFWRYVGPTACTRLPHGPVDFCPRSGHHKKNVSQAQDATL